MDFKKKIEKRVGELLETKRTFHVLYVSDGDSRLSCVRGYTAMQQFKQFYSRITNVSVTSMDSATFCDARPDLSGYNVLWIDNVVSRRFNDAVMDGVGKVFDALEPGWRKGAEALEGAAREEYMAEANEYRAMTLRVIYSLDEFVWDAPAARNRTIVDALTVEDAMSIADTVIVPNNEMVTALKQLKLVAEGKEVLVIPTFVSTQFYPTHKMFERSNLGVSSIRKPNILVKGTEIPKNVQDFIIHGTDSYKFTVCTVGELDERLMNLMRPRMNGNKKEPPVVRNIMHWANPYVNASNMAETMAMERDAGFDFVILTEPVDIADDIYNITVTDTDALLAVASGSVVFAGIADAGFDKGIHLCNECGEGFVFGSGTPVSGIRNMVERWRICVNWDAAYKAQRNLMEKRLVSSPNVLAGFFHAMLGKKVSTAMKERFDSAMKETK